MKKASSVMLAFLGGLLCIGFSAQIVLGLWWMGANFTSLQLFGDTAFQVKVSGTMICDEYTGALYPAVLLMARVLGMLGILPWYSFMYILQLLLAGFAGFYLLKTLQFQKGKIGWCIWGSLVFLTFPMVMQCHLAVLPFSFVGSFLLLETAFVFRCIESQNASGLPAYEVAKVMVFYLLLGFTDTDFIFLGAVPVLVLLIYHLTFQKKWNIRMLFPVVVAACMTGILLGGTYLTREQGVYERPQKSITSVLFNRVGWTVLMKHPTRIPQEFLDNVSTETLQQTVLYQDNMVRLLEPELEASVGVTEANRIYNMCIRLVWKYHKAEIVKNCGEDLAGALCAPVITDLMLEGEGYESYAGRNLDIFLRNTPHLSELYWNYGIRWFEIALGIAVLAWLIRLAVVLAGRRNHKENAEDGSAMHRRKRLLTGGIAIGLLTVLIAVWAMLAGDGVQDYKRVIFVTCLWILGMLAAIPDFREEFDL